MDYPRIGAWLSLAIIIVAIAVATSGCTAGNTAYGYLAERGNQYCAKGSAGGADLKAYLNTRLAQNGARFTVKGINCPPAS